SYEPAESQSGLFGGNSNWRGPVWFPINYLLIESLQQFHHYYGDDFKVECPTRSGNFLTLRQIADELSNRLIKLWLRDQNGARPFERAQDRQSEAVVFPRRSAPAATTDHRYLFHEYFHGDTGAGLGASHQTGWTALVAKLIQQQGEFGTITSAAS
ncbi:MAG: glucosidase, partial [Chthoniobacterales bacterium]